MRQIWDYALPAWSVVVSALLAWLAAVATGWLVERNHRRTPDPLWESLRRRCRRPFRVTLVVIAVLISLPDGHSSRAMDIVRHIVTICLIAAVAWLLIQLARVVEDVVRARVIVDVDDNRQARRIHTQVVVLRRATVAMVGFIAIAAALTTFPQIRTFGASILASAGVLSVVVGLAAQSTLANLIAGLQIAFTDPIRIDDVVVVNDEWGRIEELTLTYVVVCTWDRRRLILPVSWFTSNVFQNWTRHESQVIGSIMLHVDFGTPIEPLREEMHRLVEASPLWDGGDWVLQVIDMTPTTLVLRGLVSSADAPGNWDLCCELREQLVAYVCDRRPEALPRVRCERSPVQR